MPWKMYEIIENIICFNCDINYSKCYKCSEKKYFYIYCEDEGDLKLEQFRGVEKEGKFQPCIFIHSPTLALPKLSIYMVMSKITK